MRGGIPGGAHVPGAPLATTRQAGRHARVHDPITTTHSAELCAILQNDSGFDGSIRVWDGMRLEI